jgi:signal transduction histidine kinase
MTEFNYRYPNHRLHFYQRHARHAKIFADPDKITQVFNNILSNAGKFSPENSLISISVTGTHDIWKVSITDRGTGIDPADLPNIFERYYQGKTDKPRGGIGLGLHLVKQILDHHQAHIHYQSRPGEGTKVTILFPQA